ncbi:COG4705 family protein [Acidisoma cladoniae]|uniref:COG4705 family protein n=1 Tax=Acidisoma cladoniae TaxID=3040935 RepID=UPI002550DDC8|nr:hypothetical protein [Acidisoma sp. PAMC 29798]
MLHEQNRPAQAMLNKVPEVTIIFWLIKIMATTVGETGADFLSATLGFGLPVTSMIMTLLLAIAIAVQFWAARYVPWIYWLTVVLVSVVGTLITDTLSDTLGVSLILSSFSFLLLLGLTFTLWYTTERTISIHSIFTTRREVFYWAAILLTFALGTAAGDLAAERLQLGYLAAAVIFGSLIAVVTLTYYVFALDAVAAFWIAYILTRPFGASCGDLLAQPRTDGGLGLGTVVTSLVFLAVILSLVTFLTLSRRPSPQVRP